jgi:ubiquitin carboxyl-terminal hydrolase 7
MGGEFLEFPPVLQLHLRRFEYDYDFDRNVKIHSRFEFPESIDLARFLSQKPATSQVYDLYGVLVHSGDVGYGHYYAFLRTSTDPQWFEFNDSSVTKVDPQRAITDNFGGSVAVGGYAQSFSAYVLIYVRRADAASILDPIRDDEVPEHIRNYTANPTSYAQSEVGTFTAFPLHETVEYQTLSSGSGFVCESLSKQLPYGARETHETIYQKVAEAFERDVDQIQLWYSTTGTPSWPFARDGSVASSLAYYKYWFANKVAPLAVSDHTGRTLFLKFFYPGWEHPLQYLGSIRLAAASLVAEVTREVNRRMGFPEDTELDLYEETLSKSATPKPVVATSTITSSQIAECAQLIFQLSRGTDLPAMTFVPKPPIAKATAAAETATELPVVEGVPRAIETVDQYFKTVVAAPVSLTLFNYSEPATPVAVLHVSAAETLVNVISMIKTSQQLEIDEDRDSLLVYNKDYHTDGPNSTNIDLKYYTTVHLAYQTAKDKKYIFFRVLKGIPQSEASTGSLVKVDLSLDSVTISKSFTVHIPVSSESFATFRKRLADQALIDPDLGPTRTFIISTTSHTVSAATDNSYVTSYTNVYIEVIPESQRDLQDGERLLTVKRAARGVSIYLEANEKPVYLKIGEQATLDDIRPEIRNLFQLTEEQEKKTKYFTGENYVQYLPTSACKGELVLSSLPRTASLFVVTDTRRKAGGYREEAVKIHN